MGKPTLASDTLGTKMAVLDVPTQDWIHDRMPALLRTVSLSLLPLGVFYEIAYPSAFRRNYISAIQRFLSFCFFLLCPPSYKWYMRYHMTFCYFLMPLQTALITAGYTMGRPFLGGLIAIPLTATILHRNRAAHLADVFFVNAIILIFAKDESEWIVSLMMTCMSVAGMWLKCALVKHAGDGTINLHSSRTPVLVLTAVVGGIAILIVHVKDFPDDIWHVWHAHGYIVRHVLLLFSCVGFVGVGIVHIFVHASFTDQAQSAQPDIDITQTISECATILQSVLDGQSSLSEGKRQAIIQAIDLLHGAEHVGIAHDAGLSSTSSLPAGTGTGSIEYPHGIDDADEIDRVDICAVEVGPDGAPVAGANEDCGDGLDAAELLLSLKHDSQSGHPSRESEEASVETPMDCDVIDSGKTSVVTDQHNRFNMLCQLAFDGMAVLEVKLDDANMEHSVLVWWNPEFFRLSTLVGNGDMARGCCELEKSVLRSCRRNAVWHFAATPTKVEVHSRSQRVWIDERNSLIFWVISTRYFP